MRTLRGSFLKLSKNPKPITQLLNTADLVNVYCTQDSIVENFQTVFGYRNETLAMRFYSLLADGHNGVYIYLPTFCIKLYGLVDGYPMHLNVFGFKLLDSKKTGEIYATDISDMITNGLAACPDTASDLPYPNLVGAVAVRAKVD